MLKNDVRAAVAIDISRRHHAPVWIAWIAGLKEHSLIQLYSIHKPNRQSPILMLKEEILFSVLVEIRTTGNTVSPIVDLPLPGFPGDFSLSGIEI